MSTEDSAKITSGVKCGACGEISDSDAKFCAGCGHSLVEKCIECGKQVLLTQKFCGSCGTNLKQHLKERYERMQGELSEAVRYAKEFKYDEALGILGRASKVEDYRLAELTGQAKAAYQKVESLRQNAVANANGLFAQAKAAYDNDNQSDAARLLKQIPDNLRSEEMKDLLSRSLHYLGQESSVITELQESLKKRDWLVAGGLLQQAISLAPNGNQYQKLADQVAEKLYAMATQFFEQCAYRRALDCMDSIPEVSRTDVHAEKYAEIDQLQWYGNQLSQDPFATAVLGRLAVRFSKDAPHDESAKRTIQHLSAAVKSRPVSPRSPWARWRGHLRCHLGGDFEFLAYPQGVTYEADSAVRKNPGRFNVALGWLIRGLGLGRIKQGLLEQKGFFSSFGKRKAKSVWGVDLGAYALHAVQVELDDDGDPIVVDSCYAVLRRADLSRWA